MSVCHPPQQFEHEALFERIKDRLHQHLTQLSELLTADFVMVAMLSDDLTQAKVIKNVSPMGEEPTFSYSLAGTPCADVAESDMCVVVDNPQEQFPDDHLLAEFGVETYIGMPVLCKETNRPVGIIAALYTKRKEEIDINLYLFKMMSNVVSLKLKDAKAGIDLEAKIKLLNEVGQISHTGGWEYLPHKDQFMLTDEVFSIFGIAPQLPGNASDTFWVFPESERARLLQQIDLVSKGKGTFCSEFWLISNDGHKKWVLISGRNDGFEPGSQSRVYGAFEDISSYKKLLQEEHEQRRYMEVILDNIQEALITYDDRGYIQSCNSLALKMFGYLRSELNGCCIEKVVPGLMDKGQVRNEKKSSQLPNESMNEHDDSWFGVRRDGTKLFLEINLSKVKNQGQDINIALLSDISEKIDDKNTIYQLAYLDRIAKLPNKFWFKREIADTLTSCELERCHLLVAMVDIDKLSLINFKFGYAFGDKVIHALGARLKELEKNGYKIFKNGTDSYFILSAGSNRDYAHLSEDKDQLEYDFQRLISQPFQIDDVTLEVQTSMSSIIVDKNTFQYERVVSLLENGMILAQKQHSKRTFFVSNSFEAEYERKAQLRDALLNAIVNDELALVFQPQFNQQSQSYSSEALLRWVSPIWGNVSPVEFIPLAEESHLIIDLGDWVLDRACEVIAELVGQDIEHSVSVNVSAKQFMQPDFVRKVTSKIAQYAIPTNLLCLELTESCLVGDVDQVQIMMQQLAEQGIRFSIDDFGTGYSSLQYLKALPIRELKIDKYFVDDVMPDTGEEDLRIIKTIIEMARALHVDIVAEGVENEYQFDYLCSLGCDNFQGYLFSKPLDHSKWLKKLTEQASVRTIFLEGSL